MRRFIIPGLLGAIALIAWMFVVDAILGYKRSIEMNALAQERTVYEVLKEHVTEPGKYVCNPELKAGGEFPGDEPVFSIQFSGVGHAGAGQEVLVGLFIGILASILGAWLLSNASHKILESFARRVLFVVVIGIVVALFSNMARFGIGGYSMSDALALALREVLAWLVVGFVLAWRVRPATTTPA